jgi:thiamine-phosphate pyrophosphorylase
MAVFAEMPRLYPILDAGLLVEASLSIEDFAGELREAGIRFLQYRDKQGSDDEVRARGALLRRIFPVADSCLVLNDRVALAATLGFDGVHVGQDDVEPARVREILGPGALIGFSTHGERQLRLAGEGPADYVAIGPVYPTLTKQNPDPVVGVEAVRLARSLTLKPLVAIGGITLANCLAARHAGADSVAVISALLPLPGQTTQGLVSEFLARLSAAAFSM